MSNDHTKYIVYKVVNKTNKKIYIGQTKETLKRRKLVHESRARKGSTTKFHKDLMKYGFSNFKWEVLEETTTRKEAREKETYYIRLYNTVETGYNCNYGDGCPIGRPVKPETIAKLKEKAIGRVFLYRRGPNAKDSKEYIVTTPSGDEYYVHGLSDFCRRWDKDKLHMELLIKVAKGIRNHHKNYKCRYFDEKNDKKENYKQF